MGIPGYRKRCGPDQRSDIRGGVGLVPDVAALIQAMKLTPNIRPINDG
jgi:hypothetical protein